jgi:hypothetical protein
MCINKGTCVRNAAYSAAFVRKIAKGYVAIVATLTLKKLKTYGAEGHLPQYLYISYKEYN